MTTVRIIGIMGFAGSGKDTLAEMFRKRVGGRIFKFATKLTEIATRLDPMIQINPVQWTVSGIDNVADAKGVKLCQSYSRMIERAGSYDAAEREFVHFRPMLVNIGQGMRDVFGNDFWVEHTMLSIDEAAKHISSTELTELSRESEQKKAKEIAIEIAREADTMYAMITDVRYPSECEAILSRGGIILHVKRAGVGAANQTEAQSIADAEKYVNIIVDNNTTLEGLEGKCDLITQVLEHLFDK